MSKPNPVTQLCMSNSFSSSNLPSSALFSKNAATTEQQQPRSWGFTAPRCAKNFATTGSNEKEPLVPLSAKSADDWVFDGN